MGADPWTWTYEGYDPEDEGLRETLCATGNGYLTTRAAEPSSQADDVHYPGTYAAGIYDRLTTPVDGHGVSNESLVNLPNWLDTTFRIGDGDWWRIDDHHVTDYEQTFDLRRGVLSRRYTVRDAAERVTTLTQRQLVSMREKHCAVLEYSVTPQNWSGTVQIRSGIDAGVTNSLVSRYRELRGDHLRCTLVDHPDESTVRAVVETVQSHVRVAMAARLSVLVDGRAHSPRRSRVTSDDWVGQCLSVDVEQGSTVTAEKVVMVVTSRDRAISEPGEQSTRWLSRTGSVDEILSRHVQAWSHLWDRFFVDIPDKPEELRVLRLHLTHLLQTASSHTVDLDVGIPARGLTGEAYRGHILWDELFVFPMLTLRLPVLTRSLLLYRYRRLPEARAAARAAGYSGAMFPWQSGSDGREESQDLHLNPASGRWIDDPTHRQRHVGLAIAYNVWQYLEATDDQEFLVDVGARTILEIARFFGSLAEHDRGLGRYMIRGSWARTSSTRDTRTAPRPASTTTPTRT